jgi:hypothetical protein
MCVANRGDATVLQQNVGDAIQPNGGIDHATGAEQ